MTDWPPPRFDPIKLRCKCGHEWQDWTPQCVTAEVAVAMWRSYRCPVCAKKRGIAFVRLAAPDDYGGGRGT